MDLTIEIHGTLFLVDEEVPERRDLVTISTMGGDEATLPIQHVLAFAEHYRAATKAQAEIDEAPPECERRSA